MDSYPIDTLPTVKNIYHKHEHCSSAPHNYTKVRNIVQHAIRHAYHISKTFVISSDWSVP